MTSKFKCETRFWESFGIHGEAMTAMLWGLMRSEVELGHRSDEGRCDKVQN